MAFECFDDDLDCTERDAIIGAIPHKTIPTTQNETVI